MNALTKGIVAETGSTMTNNIAKTQISEIQMKIIWIRSNSNNASLRMSKSTRQICARIGAFTRSADMELSASLHMDHMRLLQGRNIIHTISPRNVLASIQK